ncbi:uncharacterized protein LOC110030922 isoform X2 [Phalaenopsis equestris]|uniref:uncharacterized protein LOC110030922 isoform X2 n=1 Tax=Phalaenopsis equestris TaxID=78828 RepID=UPI0009E38065|nr:uncharacterized protein LOC110030922 isoform X2 [Phalaenopsis equestris]
MTSIRRLLSPIKTSAFSISLLSPPFSVLRNPFRGRSGLVKILPKHAYPESETHVLAFGRILQKKAWRISNLSGQKLFVGSFLGFSVATGLTYQFTNSIYAMDDNYAETVEPSGFLKDDLHAFWSLARKFQLPVVLLVTVLLGWRHPFALAINVGLLLFCTRPNPFSIYMFVEQFLYVKKVEVEDYKILCMARVELRDMKLDVIGILGGWWVFQTSPAHSTGFYHDPNDGWYYSSRDGLYYRFENGTYVLITCAEEEKLAAPTCTGSVSSEPTFDSCNGTKNELPPSQWIEETLIDLYLSGYNNNSDSNPDSLTDHMTNEQGCQVQCEGLIDYLALDGPFGSQNGTENLQNNEPTSDDEHGMDVLTHIISSKEEENWHAQYGQVTCRADDDLPPFFVVDLWDWEMIMETVKNSYVSRLMGRVTKRSSKLHPSIPANGSLLKTAAIREVHLDFVRVESGRVYRLRSPSIKYLVSLSTYDSSNPTKDWDFPDFFSSNYEYTPVSHDQDYNLAGAVYANSSSTIDEMPSMAKMKTGSEYRDRAAERRALHGGFGTGLGEKSFLDDDYISGESRTPETNGILNEAINASFGPGSCARKILEGMGWKHGESLGSSNKGILEPLCPVGNKGYSGLGWNHARGEN